MHERQDEIEVAHPHTFDWVFSDPKAGIYDWLKGDGGLFWIRGKPASGKSTLIKYILEDGRTLEALHQKYGQDSVTMPGFFFHNRGANLTQKSLDGLLRSILFQILSDLPTLIGCVVEVYRNARDPQGYCAWHLAELKKALNSIVRQNKISGCILLFIDALDEFVGTDIEIARFMTDLLRHQNQQALQIRICASSRPHNVFYDMLGDFPSLAIHDWTRKDISIYTSDRLGECRRKGLEVLHDEITSRAQGVFLWVKLVIEELSDHLFGGESIPVLVKRLSQLPDDLSVFYRLLLERLPREKRAVAQKMVELVLCSQNRISLVTLTAGVKLPRHGFSTNERLKQEPFDILLSCEEMVRQVRSCSGGLLEVVQTQEVLKGKSPKWLYEPLKKSQFAFTRQYVQLLHQTAKEFVNDPLNSDLMSGNSAMDNGLAGHLRLMEVYISIAQIGKPRCVESGPPFWFSVLPGEIETDINLSLWSDLVHHSHQIPIERRSDYGIFDTDLIPSFYYNARQAEYLSGKSNVELVKEFQNVLYAHCGQHWPLEYLKHTEDIKRARQIIHTFPIPFAALTSPIAIALYYGLYSYAQEVLFNHHFKLDEKQLSSLLYWAYMGVECNSRGYAGLSLPGLQFKRHQFLSLILDHGANPNTKIVLHYARWRRMAGAESCKAEEAVKTEDRIEDRNPESVIIDEEAEVEGAAKKRKLKDIFSSDRIEDRVEQPHTSNETDVETPTSSGSLTPMFDSTANYVLVEDDLEMSILHFVLGWESFFSAVYSDMGIEDTPLLDAICLLVNYGADVNENPLRTSWLSGLLLVVCKATSQSALHYLLMRRFQSGPRHSHLIKAFLEHGADPNAVDSNGRTVLECALPICPYDVIELMLKKGAKITPGVLSESGTVEQYFHTSSDFETMVKKGAKVTPGVLSESELSDVPYVPPGNILNEMRWRRPECYTDEARELARPHNPHWAELEKTTTMLSFASRLWARAGFR